MNFNVINPYPFVYHFRDPQGVCFSIIKGKDKAIVVDCGYGIFNIRELIENYIDTPYMVICTHGHMDHSCGNYQFDEVFINELDVELCKKHNGYNRRLANLKAAESLNLLKNDFDKDNYLIQNEGNLKIVNFDNIDLGDLLIKIIPLEGHTKGSIGFLIVEDNLLITSDAICPWVWMFLEESTTVSTYLNMLKETIKLPFTGFLLGHGSGQIMPKDEINKYIKVTEDIDLSKAVKVSFNNFEDLNSYCYSEYKVHEPGKWGIIFNPDKLK